MFQSIRNESLPVGEQSVYRVVRNTRQRKYPDEFGIDYTGLNNMGLSERHAPLPKWRPAWAKDPLYNEDSPPLVHGRNKIDTKEEAVEVKESDGKDDGGDDDDGPSVGDVNDAVDSKSAEPTLGEQPATATDRIISHSSRGTSNFFPK